MLFKNCSWRAMKLHTFIGEEVDDDTWYSVERISTLEPNKSIESECIDEAGSVSGTK
jgi:hypothetical protein